MGDSTNNHPSFIDSIHFIKLKDAFFIMFIKGQVSVQFIYT